jgi:hypothetical protein
MSTRLTRAIAWLYAAALVFLTLGSPRYRFETMLPHNVEHLVQHLGPLIRYRVSVPPSDVLLAGVGYVATLEVLQIWAAGRHARWIDFAMDALGFCIGFGVDLVASRVRDQLTAN